MQHNNISAPPNNTNALNDSKKHWAMFGCGSLLVIFILVSTVASVALTQVPIDIFNNMSVTKMAFDQIWQSLGLFVVLPGILLLFFYQKHALQFLKLDKKPAAKSILLAFLLVLSAGVVLDLVIQYNEKIGLPTELSNFLQQLHDLNTSGQEAFLKFTTLPQFVMVFIAMAIMPAITEEFLFRGVIQNSLSRNNIHPALAIGITAFLFAIMHLQFYYFFGLFLMGVLLGLLYYWSNSLWVPIIAHLINNGLIVIGYGLYNFGYIKTNPLATGHAPLWLSILGIVIFLPLIYTSKKQLKQA